MGERICIGGCGATFTGCFGFQIARDTLAHMDGLRATIREICANCAFRCSEEYVSEFGGTKPLDLETLLAARP